MKAFKCISIIFFLVGSFLSGRVIGQSSTSSGLKAKLETLKHNPNYLTDSNYLKTLNKLASNYSNSYPDTALFLLKDQVGNCKKAGYGYGEVAALSTMGNAWQTKGNFEKALASYQQAYQLAQKYKFNRFAVYILGNIGLVYTNQGNYPEALNKFYKGLEWATAQNDKLLIGSILNNIAIVHFYQGKMQEADSAYQITLQIALDLKDSSRAIYAYNNIGEVNLEQDKTTSAIANFQKAYNLALVKENLEMQVAITNNLGNTYFKNGNLTEALLQYENALQLALDKDYGLATCKALLGLAKAKHGLGREEEALKNGLEALQKAEEMGQTQLIRDANQVVADIYEKSGNGLSALKHYKQYMIYADSLNNIANERAAANEKANYQITQNTIRFQKKSLQQQWILFSALAALLTVFIILWIINRNKKRLTSAYKNLQVKNELIATQQEQTEEALSKLKETQAQLILSEKMASLGELAAGIAHEIQNPLNFVNNFSEVSYELIDELNEGIARGDIEEVKILSADIKENLKKIGNHGKRADSIVKGMLQHSRSSSGTKEPTDINTLADEYLRLAYHGLRAKDKNFNAKLVTDFDETIGKIEIVPQEIGRVCLNLITNALHACRERLRNTSEGNINSLSSPTDHTEGSAENKYSARVSITTKKVGDTIEIRVSDNGIGIPQNVVDKIFQPFFTTKPPGEGTGLGLSMSYDIIKAHNGKLLVNSVDGEGSTFTIILEDIKPTT